MNKGPRVAVVIAAWNSAGSLPRAVRSALRQTGVDISVIIVDHGSTDDSSRIIMELVEQHSRVRGVRLERAGDEVRSAARPSNVGLNLALSSTSAEWFVRLDSDDFFARDDVLAVALESKNDKTRFLNARILLWNERAQVVTSYGPSHNFRTRAALLSGGAYCLAHHCTLVRRDLLLEAQFPLYSENIRYGEDLDVSLNLLAKLEDDEVSLVATDLMVKVLHEASITGTLAAREKYKDLAIVLARNKLRWSWLHVFVAFDFLLQPLPVVQHLANRLIGTTVGRYGYLVEMTDAHSAIVARSAALSMG